MARRPKPGICTYCLEHFEVLTWDHVLPESFYVNNSKNVEKWKVPSCRSCNESFGRSEKILLTKLGMGMDPNHPKYGVIPQKALASLNPARGRGIRDAKARKAERMRLRSEIQDMSGMPENSVLPGFGKHNQFRPTNNGLLVSANDIQNFVEKVVRGVTLLEDKRLIEPPFIVEHFLMHDIGALEFMKILRKHGKVLEKGEAIEIVRVTSEDDPRGSAMSVSLWGRFKFYAFVTDQESNRDA